MRNPDAVQAMEDLEFLDIRETTIEDVVNSRMIADPLHLLECCMISDGGGAVVIIASAEVAKELSGRHRYGYWAPERQQNIRKLAATLRRALPFSQHRSHSQMPALHPLKLILL